MMVMVFRLVLTTFCSWFPSARLPQTRTIAVHGLEPSKITATMSCSLPLKSRYASPAATKGATTQFENRLSMIGFGLFFSFFSSDICRFNMAGYIIRNKQMPMGMEIPRICQESMASPIPGTVRESTTPTTMQSATHRARYFSNLLIILPPCFFADRSLSVDYTSWAHTMAPAAEYG